jgi:hypothetical protein
VTGRDKKKSNKKASCNATKFVFKLGTFKASNPQISIQSAMAPPVHLARKSNIFVDDEAIENEYEGCSDFDSDDGWSFLV